MTVTVLSQELNSYSENSYNCNSKLRKKLQQFSRPYIIRHTLCLQSRTIYHHDTNVSTISTSIYKLVQEMMCPVINSAMDFTNKLTVVSFLPKFFSLYSLHKLSQDLNLLTSITSSFMSVSFPHKKLCYKVYNFKFEHWVAAAFDPNKSASKNIENCPK